MLCILACVILICLGGGDLEKEKDGFLKVKTKASVSILKPNKYLYLSILMALITGLTFSLKLVFQKHLPTKYFFPPVQMNMDL